MTVRDIQTLVEGWAPTYIAWEKDNVGLQVGSPDAEVRSLFVCLDVTERIIREAASHRADLVISHHPLLFRPVRSVRTDDHAGRCIDLLLRHRMSLYSAHTNMDFARSGTSFALAETLGLTGVDFLLKSFTPGKKIVTYVPPGAVERVARAMADAGAGRIGNYEHCSFRSTGVGTFRGMAQSSPRVGMKGRLERVEEVRVEMVVDTKDVSSVVKALKATHPYEEVAYDIHPLENVSSEYGMGAVGDLPRRMELATFTRHVMSRLKVKGIRSVQGGARSIARVAVCGGSGSDLLGEAIRSGAQAFITADVKYHAFHEAYGKILLMDAGHYETEWPLVRVLTRRLREEFLRKRARLTIHAARTSTNPIIYN